MKKIILIFLFFCNALILCAHTIDTGLTSNTQIVNTNYNLSFFITNYYHQLMNDSSHGEGAWLNSLYHELQFEDKEISKNNLGDLILNSHNPITLLTDLPNIQTEDNTLKIDDFLQCDDVRVCFATPFLGNPMSYFGHVYLEFYREDNPLFSYCLSYIGDIQKMPKGEAITKGFIGSLNGIYSIQPFYVFYDKYVINENRNIISYKLNLSDRDKSVLLHLISNNYYTSTKYSFMFNNCMDGLLDLLNQVDSINLNNKVINSPLDLINQLEKYHLLSDRKIFTSYIKNQTEAYLHFTEEEKELYHQLVQSENRPLFLESLDEITKNDIGSLLSTQYFINFKQNNKFNDDYHDIMNFKFPNLPITNNNSLITIPTSTGYIDYSYVRNLKSDSYYHKISMRPLFSDIGEQYYSDFNQGAMELFKMDYIFTEDNFNLDSITWLDLTSLNRISQFQSKISWKLSMNNKRENDCFPFTLDFYVGPSIGRKKSYLFTYLKNTYISNPLNYECSLGSSFYYIEPRSFVFNANINEKIFSDLHFTFHVDASAQIQYYLSSNKSILMNFAYPQNEISLSFRYYYNVI